MDIIVGRVYDIFSKMKEFEHDPDLSTNKWISMCVRSEVTYTCKCCGRKATVVIKRGRFWINGNMFNELCNNDNKIFAFAWFLYNSM